MKFKIVMTAKGKERVIDEGPLTKMRSRLKSLRASTRKGVSGRGGVKYSVEYKILPSEERP